MTSPAPTLGVIATCAKPHERRVPIHPEHLDRLPGALRARLVFEAGYGAAFGWPDARLGAVAPRADLLAGADVVLLLKPDAADLAARPAGSALWGWPHCVQQRAIAQAAIDRGLTLGAFEAMFEPGPDGAPAHTFRRNNALAGYAAVLHALALAGVDGRYGRPRRVVVLGAGAVARGAIEGLRAHGFDDVTVCLPEGEAAPAGCAVVRVRRDAADPTRMIRADGAPLLELLLGAEILVNAILQDPLRPVVFLGAADAEGLAAGALILDVSCDAGMGFAFARPTSFDAPTFRVGPATYYGVDHTPSYLWDAASWAISEALLPHLGTIAAGPAAWAADPVLGAAIAIERGVVRDPAILAFQGREAVPPHAPLVAGHASPDRRV